MHSCEPRFVLVRNPISNTKNVLIPRDRSRIQCVDVEKRLVCASLDVRKVMPGSETIHTIDVDLACDSVVTCMCLLEKSDGDHLYIGTSRGLVVVAQAATLQPISACRPYESEITSMSVMEEAPREDDRDSLRGRSTLSTASSESGLGWVRERVSETVDRFRTASSTVDPQGTALLATIGRHFRSLSHRFVSETKLADVYSIVIWRTDEWTI
ncbi:unnamed protein product [Caenorhabditis auriculariae]|uniref:Uncharacterized protein n=1 Tax=Caenorhabditis auriculariae TaxID=2777116 RepID=A0A8S1GUH0_9PELO|nr:unnamed protein product [Caenorhabditis auriculariae]